MAAVIIVDLSTTASYTLEGNWVCFNTIFGKSTAIPVTGHGGP
jgi:hypothetical protein